MDTAAGPLPAGVHTHTHTRARVLENLKPEPERLTFVVNCSKRVENLEASRLDSSSSPLQRAPTSPAATSPGSSTAPPASASQTSTRLSTSLPRHVNCTRPLSAKQPVDESRIKGHGRGLREPSKSKAVGLGQHRFVSGSVVQFIFSRPTVPIHFPPAAGFPRIRNQPGQNASCSHSVRRIETGGETRDQLRAVHHQGQSFGFIFSSARACVCVCAHPSSRGPGSGAHTGRPSLHR